MPPTGGSYAVVVRAGAMPRHIYCKDLTELANKVISVDRHPEDLTAYFALATYREPFVMGINGKGEEVKQWRVNKNRMDVKSFWVDLDCGEEKAADGKGYKDKKEAVAALLEFCKTVALPMPLVVSSGRGIHAYWPLTEAISFTEWEATATKFKMLAAQEKLLADPTRTADAASILRPVGTHNKKAAPLEVKVLLTHKIVLAPTDFDSIVTAALHEDVSALSLFSKPLPDYLKATADETAASHSRAFLPSDADKVADGCQQINVFRATGAVEYPVWFAAIGVLKHCTNGEQKAHEWSAKHTSYTAHETQFKYDSYNAGPSTCEKFRSDNPKSCEGCPHAEQVTSPVQLGAVAPPVKPAEIVTVVVDTEVVEVEVPQLPEGYWFEDGVMYGMGFDKKGNQIAVAFANSLFYLTEWAKSSEGYLTKARTHEKHGGIREFELPIELIAEGSSGLRKHLGKNAVLLTNNRESINVMSSYLASSVLKLKEAAAARKQLTQLGWNADLTEFALGSTIYRAGGETVEATLSGAANREGLTPKGDVNDWIAGINTMYNHDGMEPYQYAICTALGSLLTPIAAIDKYNGIPLAFTGTKSGTGKTTVCASALSALGNSNNLTINGLRHGTTKNGLYASFAALQNIPLLIDEVTNSLAKDFSELMYCTANGQSKVRCDKAGNPLPVFRWAMSCFMTGNGDISATMSAKGKNSEAESVRLIEIYADDIEPPMQSREVAIEALGKIASAAGTPAVVFINYCLNNMEAVKSLLRAINMKIETAIGEGHAERRFYIGHATCTMAAAKIMKQLGLISFNTQAMYDWIIAYLEKRCDNIKNENEQSAEAIMSDFMNEFGRNIIVSKYFNSLRGGNMRDGGRAVVIGEQLSSGVSAPFVGRYVTGGDEGGAMAGKLIVKTGDLRHFCVENRYSFKNLMTSLVNQNCLYGQARGVRYTLTQGIINQPQINATCIVIDVTKLYEGSNIPALTLVENNDAQEETAT
ncbi:DUF927 domain-containing protein [Undibacterium sp. Ji42W]|uniref:DUF927 domain-containing protein n=1 Tax=Undibacterium sp. Ji42W TaxID=3413039 RepID=UPI003BF4C3F7